MPLKDMSLLLLLCIRSLNLDFCLFIIIYYNIDPHQLSSKWDNEN